MALSFSSPMTANVIAATTLETVVFVVDDGRRMVGSAKTTSEMKTTKETYTTPLENLVEKYSNVAQGMLLRWFVNLYDLEIVEEDAFLKWKEDITDVYPGKGKALFQVNQWLMWLAEAESEEEDDGDN